MRVLKLSEALALEQLVRHRGQGVTATPAATDADADVDAVAPPVDDGVLLQLSTPEVGALACCPTAAGWWCWPPWARRSSCFPMAP